MNKRVLRTTKAIDRALLKLLQEQSPEEITIQEIADEAGINRVTFYAHYRNKNEAIQHCCQTFVNSLYDSTGESSEDMFINTFTAIKRNAAVINRLSQGPTAPYFVEALQKWMSDWFRNHRTKAPSSVTEEVVLQALIYSNIGILLWYGQHCQTLTPQAMAKAYEEGLHLPVDNYLHHQ
jgi:AcrR family transcriptional regulator